MPTGIYKRILPNWNKGKKHSEETKKKIRKNHPDFNGKNNPNWKGDNVGYRGIHAWVQKEKGKASNYKCKCGKQAEQWANIDNSYKRVLEDYIAMCTKCHKKYDKKTQKKIQHKS